MSKKKELLYRKKIDLELLHQRLGHRFNRSLLAGDTSNVWEILSLEYIQTLLAYHVKLLQRIKSLGLKHH